MLVQERKTEDMASPPSEKEITVGRKKKACFSRVA